mgnify:CR=1 FL=1
MDLQIATYKAEIQILTIIALSKLNYILWENRKNGVAPEEAFTTEEIVEMKLNELIYNFIDENGANSGESLLPFLKETLSRLDFNKYRTIIRDTNAHMYFGCCPFDEDPAITADASWGA